MENIINNLGNKLVSIKFQNSKPIAYQAQGRLRVGTKVVGKDIKVVDADPVNALKQLEIKLKEKLENFNDNNSN